MSFNLSRIDLPAHHLKLEITEAALDTLLKLKRIGAKLALDDFGTGYSALSHLSRFPMDALKVNRLFVNRLESDPDSAAIISTVMAPGSLASQPQSRTSKPPDSSSA